MTARILIVDDECLVRDYLRQICTDILGMSVVGLAAERDTAILLLREQRPDLALVDLRLGWHAGNGIEVAAWAKAEMPLLRILFISACGSIETIRKVEAARVSGFVDKISATAMELASAIQAVADGLTYFSPSYLRAVEKRHRDSSGYEWLLSDRERQVLQQIASGMNDFEIATFMELSVRTVETHRHRILSKLGLDSTPKLMKFASDHGFMDFAGQGLPAPGYVV
jgi:two-component system nitrate/nitrite response regulator NarL